MYSKADLHMHTTASDGILSPAALVNDVLIKQLRAQRGYHDPFLRVIAVTDHDTIAGAREAHAYLRRLQPRPDLEVLVGSEISSRDGHILALDIDEDIPKGMSASDTVDAIHEQGGVAIAAHPYANFPLLPGLEGIKDLIRDPIVGGKLDAVEVRNSNFTELFNNYLAQYQNRRSLHLAEVGGSDSHFPTAVGKTYTLFPGRTADDLLYAIRYRETVAAGRVYGLRALYTYFRDRAQWRQYACARPVTQTGG